MNIKWLGDPHLGRKFENGVPLHRRGEREEMQWDKFRTALMTTDAEVHVCMGDLFDKFIVAPEVVLRAAYTYADAINQNPSTLYVVLRGNHDVSRNMDKSSSFELFEAITHEWENLWVISTPTVYENVLFVPYDPFNYDHLEDYIANEVDTVFSHFDIVDFGGHNVIPAEMFSRNGIALVVNGHDHVARVERRHNVEIIVTGSMEPFTHAEDPEQKAYITLTLAELAGRDLTNMNVRVLLADGETLPTELDCLSLTAKRVSSDEVVTVDTTTFDALDLGDMLSNALGGLAVKDLIMGFYHDHKSLS